MSWKDEAEIVGFADTRAEAGEVAAPYYESGQNIVVVRTTLLVPTPETEHAWTVLILKKRTR